MTELHPSIIIQFISCTAACVGFGLWFNVKGKQVLFCGIGAFCTWGMYVISDGILHNYFLATLVSAIFVAGYAQVMARVNKAPATIFQSVCAFPLVPGNNLYFVMYAMVMDMPKETASEGKQLVLNCLGIAMGFMVIEIVNQYGTLFYRKLKKA